MSGSAIRAEGPDPVARLLRGGSVYTLAMVAQLGAGVLVLPLLTRILDPAEFGTATAALVVYNLLGVSIGLGLPAAITRAYFHADEREFGRDGTLGLIWATAIGAGLCALVLELTGPAWAAVFEDLEYGTPLRLAVFAAAAYAVMQAGQSVLRAEERAGSFVATAVVVTAGAQLAGLAGALISGVDGYMTGVFAGTLGAAGLAVWLAGAHRAPRLNGEVALRNLRIGLPVVPHAVALYVLAAGDRIVIERLDGLTAVARYQVAYLIGFVVLLLSQAINNAWSPIVYGADEERRWTVLAATTATVTRVVALAAAAVAIAAPIALEVAAPADYNLGGLEDITALVALAAVPFACYLACAQAIIWQARTGWLGLITPLVAAANIALTAILVAEYGLIGGGVATLASYSVLAALLVSVTRRVAPVPWPWRSIGASGGLAAAVCAVALAIPADGGWLIARGAAALPIAFALIRLVVSGARPQAVEPAGST